MLLSEPRESTMDPSSSADLHGKRSTIPSLSPPYPSSLAASLHTGPVDLVDPYESSTPPGLDELLRRLHAAERHGDTSGAGAGRTDPQGWRLLVGQDSHGQHKWVYLEEEDERKAWGEQTVEEKWWLGLKTVSQPRLGGKSGEALPASDRDRCRSTDESACSDEWHARTERVRLPSHPSNFWENLAFALEPRADLSSGCFPMIFRASNVATLSLSCLDKFSG